MTETEVARDFSDVLTAVVRDGETIEITREGRTVAKLSAAKTMTGAELLRVMREFPFDEGFADDVRRARAFMEGREDWPD